MPESPVEVKTIQGSMDEDATNLLKWCVHHENVGSRYVLRNEVYEGQNVVEIRVAYNELSTRS